VQISFKAKQMGLNLTPIQLFRHPTVARLALELDRLGSEHTEQNGLPTSLSHSGESEETNNYNSPDFPFASLNDEKMAEILKKLSR
jgi:hypothetical protein